jgi:hypothetical protein
MTEKKIDINTNRIDPYKNFKFRTTAPATESEPANVDAKKKAAPVAKKATKKAAAKS